MKSEVDKSAIAAPWFATSVKPSAMAQKSINSRYSTVKDAAKITKGKRNRVAVRTRQINFRADDPTFDLLNKLAEHIGGSQSDAIKEALLALAESKGIRS